MSKTILVTVSDDRFGRKDGRYREIQNKVTNLFKEGFGIEAVYDFTINDFNAKDVPILKHADPAINGRAYKPLAIHVSLSKLDYGDFLIYTDCSPELWDNIQPNINADNEFDLEVIKLLCVKNGDFLLPFVKWADYDLKQGDLGLHTHKNFTTNRCMDVMDKRFYEYCYMPASSFMCIRKTPETLQIVSEWVKYNVMPECGALGYEDGKATFWDEENSFKMGHRHDQSILGLLLSEKGYNFVDILYNDIAAYNFLNFCRKNVNYTFISGNPEFKEGDTVINKQGVQMKVWRVDNENGKKRYIVGQIKESCYGTNAHTLKKA